MNTLRYADRVKELDGDRVIQTNKRKNTMKTSCVAMTNNYFMAIIYYLLMSNSSLHAPSIGTSTSPQSRSLVRLLIGNVSKFLPEKTSTDFTHKWTVYVRAVGPEQFTDRSFIRKVVFRLHESFYES
uniref:Uncharacterized protein n=1 Tax=Meloidogyne enterolobii TaxID=390850 RepID=A0A6V7U2K3_MELEN|nr:unnamed protein product [Meloidogyne enterolobii]